MEQNSPLENFWSLNKEEALKLLSATDKGLSSDAANNRIKQYGPNSFKAGSKSSSVILFLSQFKSPITLLLSVLHYYRLASVILQMPLLYW